jgi:signal transduction histidine kinase
VELQVDVLRRQASPADPATTSELGRIQSLLREEVLKLRELMQEMKSMDVDSKRLLRVLTDTVDRFQRETGIEARFVSDAGEIDLPQRVCRELARIVQEGLVNVRKHSGAHQVLVRLARREKHLLLTLEDDGKGFSFAGHHSQSQLDELGKAPMIIQERVRLIEGQLAIESSPGNGARLEVVVPVS